MPPALSHRSVPAWQVPYVGVVNSCDPREGLYVKFDSSPEEMLITNEDDWRWGSHSRKPPETSGRSR
jgi:hypothetical protein